MIFTEEVKNDEISLIFKKVKMNTDFEFTNENDQLMSPFNNLKSGFCAAVIGPQNSGKSTSVINLLSRGRFKGQRRSLKGLFDTITVVSPSLHTIDDNIFEKIPDIFKHKQLTADVLLGYNDMLEQQLDEENDHKIDDKNNKKMKKKVIKRDPILNLLILDDVGSSIRKKENKELFETLVLNRRHTNTSILMCLQNYFQIPNSVRNNLSFLFIYKPKDISEEKKIFALTKMKPKFMDNFFKQFYRKKTDVMLIDMTLRESADYIFYRNFKKINFEI
jgi:hypothetical protein